MLTADDLLTEPAARRASLARDAAAALTAHGWRTTHAARHSAGTADIAAQRSWSRGRLTARVLLVIRCDSRDARLVFTTLEDAADRLPSYSLGDDDPRQRRALAGLLDDAQLHAAAYPREKALIEPAHLDAPRARTRVAAIADTVLDEAFASIDAVKNDLLQHDLDVIGDDMDIDRDAAMQSATDMAHHCDSIYPIVLTDAELWSIPEQRRHDWIRVERASLAGQERQWIDVVHAFPSYAGALTRHISAVYRKRRFAPAGASFRS
jgi:hypothetical protein